MIFRNSISVAALLLPGLATAAVFDRSLHMVYALAGGKGLPQYTDEQLLNYFDQVKPGVTALVPFLLNVANASQYEPMIKLVQSKGITIVPGVGKAPSAGDIDSQVYLDMAEGYKQYTDYVRIENMQGFYTTYGKAGTQNFIDYCVSIGFKHIMMNPWPTTPSGALVNFTNPECDSVFNSVSVNRSSKYVLNPDPSNWHVVNGPNEADRAIRPNIPILINYESPGPQTILTNMEESNPGSSIAAMNITVNDIIGKYKSEHLHWAPPMTESYDPIALGTWDWIAATLSRISLSTTGEGKGCPAT